MIRRVRHLADENRGVTAVEFAILAPIALTLMLGMIELGYQAYVAAILQGALNKASRDSTLEGSPNKLSELDLQVRTAVKRVSSQATFTSARTSYVTFAKAGKPEDFNDDNSNGVHDADECFEDVNGNSNFDLDRGKNGQGGADDIVRYTMTTTYPRIFPVAGMLGWPKEATASATTFLRNQPFAAQEEEKIKVICP